MFLSLKGKIKALNDAIAPLKSAEQDALKGSIGLGAGKWKNERILLSLLMREVCSLWKFKRDVLV